MNAVTARTGAIFTSDWFSSRIPVWRRHVVPRFRGRPCAWLELGSYEGRSSLWMLDNVLTHPDSRIVCIDLWERPYEPTFDANIAAHPRRQSVEKLKGRCVPILSRFLAESGEETPRFDGIYVDADHQAKSVLTQAAICWTLLKPGGILIFDDYHWKPKDDESRRSRLPPKPGIDAFLTCWQHEFRLLHKGWQVFVEKSVGPESAT